MIHIQPVNHSKSNNVAYFLLGYFLMKKFIFDLTSVWSKGHFVKFGRTDGHFGYILKSTELYTPAYINLYTEYLIQCHKIRKY